MPLILCIETSSTNCSVAIASDSAITSNTYGATMVLDILEDNSDSYNHGEKLHVFIDEITTRNGYVMGDYDAIAVSSGPGSYTGLRIGVSAAKGLSFALDIPLIAIDTLKALSTINKIDSEFTAAFLDARRMEVYASIFDRSGKRVLESQPVVIEDDSFIRFRESGTISYIGTGIEKTRELLNIEQQYITEVNPTAAALCALAIDGYKKSDTVDVAYFEPNYLKEFKIGG
ncbi:peptidase M22 [Nonlabens sp. MIC269]|uniref:tRNA (adenosine(37)-N6)-threonylcarbamoyltransferase complex dimerization subunit type 1 TsaB n=1 Tax=Nonlabens sp. MIC269 TaxID=1476901 RepID=UPI00071F4BE8|nr:tRNA (adenosine(37)-N6)-threonylcarbamoyltransferase complex dimerization subunit type 1 TsaB [Nonlabens sp. MIC269]ALM21225.1 peptidase M22 [Nonlabens sp. MIC269]